MASARSTGPTDADRPGLVGVVRSFARRPVVAVLALAVAASVLGRFFVRSPLWLDEALSVNISKLPIGVVTKAMKPFFVALLIVLGMVTYIPALSLWLPRLLGV